MTARSAAALAASLASMMTAAPGAAQPAGPCSLLGPEEISQVLGMTVGPGRAMDNGVTAQGARSATCLWTVPLPAGRTPDPRRPMGGAAFAILNLMVWPGGEQDAARYLQSFRDAAATGVIPARPVALELGDEALWWGDGVAVRKAAVSFGVSVFRPSGDRAAHRPMAEALASKVVDRLASVAGAAAS